MPSVRLRPVLIALLAILAIAIAAATLNSAVAVDEGFSPGRGQGGDASEGTGPGSGGGGSLVPLGSAGGGMPSIPLPCVRFLNDPGFLLGAAVVVLGFSYGLYRRYGALAPIGFFAAFGPPTVFIYLLLTACLEADEAVFSIPSPANEGNSTAGIGSGASGMLGGGASGGGRPLMSIFLLGILGIALIAAVVLLFHSTDDDVVHEPEDLSETPPEVRAIGRVAGEAADRIEDDVDADNAVFEAWKEMTTYLEVDSPETSTPAEFAAAAVDAGMRRPDVDELTALFEEVRYGGAEPTAEREERALAALRRIEEEYAGAGE